MSKLFTPRNVAVAGGVLGGAFLFSRTQTGQNLDLVRNPLPTPGVQNVTNRFSAAGGTSSGTPAIATTLGKPEDQGPRYERGKGAGGVGLDSMRVKEGEKQQREQGDQQQEGSSGVGERGEAMNKEKGTPVGSEGRTVNEAVRGASQNRKPQHGNMKDVSITHAG